MTIDYNKQRDCISRQRWLYVLLGIAIMMCLGTVYSWSVFRIPVERIFNIGSTQSGLPYMVSLAFYALFMLLTGRILDNHKPRTIIFIGGILVSIGWILSGFAGNIYALTVTYGIITGSGVGIVYGVPMAVAAKWFPEKKGLIIGFVLIGFGLSPFITAPFANYLIYAFGIMRSFRILGIVFAVLLPLLAYPFKYPSDSDYQYLETATHATITITGVNTAQMMKSKSFKGLYISFTIGTMIGLMLVGKTSNVGIALIKLPAQTVALLMSLFAVFNGIGRPIFGWLTDKLSYKVAMLISYVLIIFASLLMLMAKAGNIALYTVAFCIFWFNLGGWLAVAPASTIAIYGTKYYSQNYGVIFTAYGVGAIIGVSGSGLLLDILQNYYMIFYFVIALCIIGIISSQKMIDD